MKNNETESLDPDTFLNSNTISKTALEDAIQNSKEDTHFSLEFFMDLMIPRLALIGPIPKIIVPEPLTPPPDRDLQACCAVFEDHLYVDINFVPGVAGGFAFEVSCSAVCGIESVTIDLMKLLGMPPGRWGFDRRNLGLDYTTTDQDSVTVEKSQYFSNTDLMGHRDGIWVKVVNKCGKIFSASRELQ